jgi:hypothetical protein
LQPYIIFDAHQHEGNQIFAIFALSASSPVKEPILELDYQLKSAESSSKFDSFKCTSE